MALSIQENFISLLSMGWANLNFFMDKYFKGIGHMDGSMETEKSFTLRDKFTMDKFLI